MRFSFYTNNTTLDLLPESVQKRKTFRKLVIRLAAAQVAIFLCIGLIVLGADMLEERAWEDAGSISRQVYALRHGPEVAAAAHVRDLGLQLATEVAFLQAHAPVDFKPIWLTAIVQARAEYMTALYYSAAGILITGLAQDIIAIETHRQNILDTSVFRYVELGRIILQDCGRYFYELRVGI